MIDWRTDTGVLQPTLLMPIIQFVLPSKDKRIKKLLHFYWEVCPKLDESGKLKQEMILVWCVRLLAALLRAVTDRVATM